MEIRVADLSDQDLLSCWQREPEGPAAQHAVTELLSRYRERIYRWCRRYVREHEQALDLAQDVLLTAYQHLADLPEGTRFGAWLYTVTRNRCLLELRRARVRKAAPVDLDTVPTPAKDPEERLFEELAEERFLALLHRVLDVEEQEAISLRCFERLPVDEVTSILGLTSVSGARGILQRARRKLRSAMERERRDQRRSERAGS